MKKLLSLGLALLMLLAAAPAGAAEAVSSPQPEDGAAAAAGGYADYLQKNAGTVLGGEAIVIDAAAFADAVIASPSEDDGPGVAWGDGGATLTYAVQLPAARRYAVYLEYETLADNLYFELGIALNGAVPFTGADSLRLEIPWRYDTDFESDSRGNHLMPAAQAVRDAHTAPLRDTEGRFDDPYLFYFPAGDSQLTITALTGGLRLKRILLRNEEEPPSYEAYRAARKNLEDGAAALSLKLDAEKPLVVSDSSITPNYERGSAATDPADPSRMLLNTIGGDSWQSPGQWITYGVDVGESGWYRVYLRARQNISSGMTVKRALLVDDRLPFQEAAELEIPFSVQWDMYALGGEQPLEIYLEKGEHTLTLLVVSREYGEITNAVLEAVYGLNSLYRDIISITGTDPDVYQDYNLAEKLPDLTERLQGAEAALSAQLKRMEEMGKKGSQTAALEDLIVQLRDFLKKTDAIPKAVEFFRSNISAVSSWVLNLCSQPLEMDYLVLCGREVPAPQKGGSLLSSVWYFLRSVAASFVNDYDMIGDVYAKEESITVWISAATGVAGRDQAQAIKQLTDERFTREYGIPVNVSTVKAGLIESMMAGVGPDVALFVGYTDPVNLAARGAVWNLAAFDGFSEAEQRFYPSAVTPFRYKGGVYALPLTQKFPMLFYRTDIFAELSLEPPATWEEFLAAIPVIQGRNMNVGLPDIFATLLVQKGGSYYNDDFSATRFDTVEAAEAFAQWCAYYADYGLPLSYDFYNRFRTGEMPMAVADYTVYLQLYAAAPEIKGFWDMVPVPGTVGEDGAVNDAVVGYGADCAIILGSSEKPESAWKFLDWFTSDDIQAAYGNLIEARLGTIGRYPTANKRAFQLLPVNAQLRGRIQEQWEKVMEVPQIPASYYVGRNLTNAYRRVIYNHENPRQTLHVYNNTINREIARKNAEIDRFTEKEG